MKSCAWLRVLSLALALLFCLGSLFVLPAFAAEAEETTDEAYEAKKAAFREKIQANDVTTDDLLIGSWVTFYSFEKDSYEDQLDRMAAAGMNFNIFPKDFGSGKMFDAAYWNDVEEQYAKRNMIYIMNGSMAESNIAPGVEYAAGKEHCVGYHVVDEPTADKFAEISRLIGIYREADQTRYPLVNLFPSYAPEWALGGTYREHVEGFVQAVGAENIEYLSHDYYPFRDGGVVMTGIYADMEVLRAVAYENGKLKTHAFPQSTAWNGTRMPTADEMRWNVYAYLAYGFKALSWFNLVCPGSSDTEGEGFRDSLIYRDGTIRDPELFAAWSDLNWEVRGLSDILMNVDVAHAYHVQKGTAGVELLPEDYFLRPDGRNDFIISVMETKEGDDEYVMLFNKNTRRKATCKFTVDPAAGVKWVEYFDPFIGEYIPVEFENGVLKDSFKPGEGRVYRLRYDDPPSETEAPTEAPTEPPTEPVTDAPETNAPAAGTAAPETTAELSDCPPAKSGCGATLSLSAVALLSVAAALVARKKKDE